MGGGPARCDGFGGGDDLEVFRGVLGEAGDAGVEVGEGVRGEVKLREGEDDAGAESLVVGLEIAGESFVEGRALIVAGGDEIGEIGAGVWGLIAAAEVAGDRFRGGGGEGAKAQQGIDDGGAGGADGAVAAEELVESRERGGGCVWCKAAKDVGSEETVLLCFFCEVFRDLGNGRSEELRDGGLVGAGNGGRAGGALRCGLDLQGYEGGEGVGADGSVRAFRAL